MLRGNHESVVMTRHFTFRQEILDKYDMEVYNAFTASFNMLPIAATVNGKYFAIHGGLSPKVASLSHF